MRAGTIHDWWPTDLRIVAHLAVSPGDIEALAEGAEVLLVDGGQDEIAVFWLDSGAVVALARATHSTIEGFTLMATGDVNAGRILDEFLREGGLDQSRVTWRPE